MRKKNIGTHNAALGKIWQKQGCRWLCVSQLKDKEPIHVSDRYCLPVTYMDGSEPLEWSDYIEYWHYAIFFMGWTCLANCLVVRVRDGQYQYFWLYGAAAHVMDHQSCFQGYKTFQYCVLMVVIHFDTNICCVS